MHRYYILRKSKPLKVPSPLVPLRRQFSSCPARPAANPLINLQAYSNTRENQWFSRSTGIPRIEFSPQLQLIRSSEGLDKTAKKRNQKLSTAGSVVSPIRVAASGRQRRRAKKASIATFRRKRCSGNRLSAHDRIAFNIGQIVLLRHETEKQELLRRVLKLEKSQKDGERAIKSKERVTAKYVQLINEGERGKVRKGTRDLLLIILGVTSVTTLCLVWNSKGRVNEEPRDVKQPLERAQQHDKMPPNPSKTISEPVQIVQPLESTKTPRIASPPTPLAVVSSEPIKNRRGSFWEGLFWS